MNPHIKSKWVAALRSGQYKQGSGRLRDKKNRFCCLGVLCNLHAQAFPEFAAGELNPLRYAGYEGCIPPIVMKWADIEDNRGGWVVIDGSRRALTGHMDAGRTFAEIADAIEAQL
jgi:hypothetical protein